MKTTASDILIDVIHDWGVDVIFGLPGGGINGLMEALRKRADTIRFVQVSMRQAEKFAASLLRGEPNRGKIISTVVEDKVREFV
jgi:thiamine pyrophosphate-dependent acetolactate synthase large subunit-like protein